MGKGLSDVPSGFGWELVEWKPLDNQFGSERGLRPDEGFTEVCEAVEVDDDVIEKGPLSELGLGFDDFGTGFEAVLDFGETRTQSTLIF